MKAANDGVRFVLEMVALVAIGYWGWRQGGSTLAKIAIAAAIVVGVSALWATFRTGSDAPVEVPTAVRVVIEVGVFAAATAALFAVGHRSWAIGFAILAAANEILNYVLG